MYEKLTHRTELMIITLCFQSPQIRKLVHLMAVRENKT